MTSLAHIVTQTHLIFLVDWENHGVIKYLRYINLDAACGSEGIQSKLETSIVSFAESSNEQLKLRG